MVENTFVFDLTLRGQAYQAPNVRISHGSRSRSTLERHNRKQIRLGFGFRGPLFEVKQNTEEKPIKISNLSIITPDIND